jgi:hypothetical protein
LSSPVWSHQTAADWLRNVEAEIFANFDVKNAIFMNFSKLDLLAGVFLSSWAHDFIFL